MAKPMNVVSYLDGQEELRRRELVWGVVRDEPAPDFIHQVLVTEAAAILREHVRERGLGEVCVSPVDVILDEAKALVVQPDVVFVSNERLHIVRDRIWGAPDLVIEVASPGTARRDRTTKLEWYRTYGVAECWLIDPNTRTVEVIGFAPNSAARQFSGASTVASTVLSKLAVPACAFFNVYGLR